MNLIALASLLLRARKMPVTADPVCATRNCCTAIKKRDKPPCFTPRPPGAEREKEKEMEILIDLRAGFDELNARHNVRPSQDPHGYNLAAMHDL
jgi:hypothetical protein